MACSPEALSAVGTFGISSSDAQVLASCILGCDAPHTAHHQTTLRSREWIQLPGAKQRRGTRSLSPPPPPFGPSQRGLSADPQLPTWLSGDARRCSDVLTWTSLYRNLISNTECLFYVWWACNARQLMQPVDHEHGVSGLPTTFSWASSLQS